MDELQGKDVRHFSDTTFDKEVVQTPGPVLVDFWAPWCGPCKIIGPVVEELAVQYKGRLQVGKVNVDENPNVASRFGIRGIPTLMLYKGGKLVEQVVGAVPKAQLQKLIEKWLDPVA
ncbi:MAG: thioredoxin [bacterium]